MSKFRRFMIFLFLLELVFLVVCDYALLTGRTKGKSNYYKVEISRIMARMEQGEELSAIDLSEYPEILSVRVFEAGEAVKNPYAVEEVAGCLYRFEYAQKEQNGFFWMFHLCYGALVLLTIGFCIYLDRKLLHPFGRMKHMTTELAKGNLSVPIPQEKSEYFKEFLWGMDMLREKLEADKVRELELMKEKKVTVLSLSHDIKTPLSACDLYLKALKKGMYTTEEDRSAALLGIESNVLKIKEYVAEITEASREDFLALEVQNTEVYLSDIQRAIAEYYTEKCSRLHIDFSMEEAENCLVYGDLERIVEVLQNLMENAIKYGDGKSIRICFSEEEEHKLITVTNSGAGLPKEEELHIFESFYRGSNCKNVSGSGLGLYICKELMHKMEGDIFAGSGENEFSVSVVLQKL